MLSGELTCWEGEKPPYPEVPLPEGLREEVARQLGLPTPMWPKLKLLARNCANCGAKLEHGRVGADVGLYDKPGGGARYVIAPLCGKCSFKVENSLAFRRQLSGQLERRAAALGYLPAELPEVKEVNPPWNHSCIRSSTAPHEHNGEAPGVVIYPLYNSSEVKTKKNPQRRYTKTVG